MVTKAAAGPVKIDGELKKKVEDFISLHRFDYPSVKNFVDKAVLKLLEENKRGKG